MSRTEISGWIQVVTGLVGLYFTVTSSAPALQALNQLGTSGGLPAEFQGAQGFIKVFLVLLAIIVLLCLVLIGLSILLGALFRGLGAKAPQHASFALVMALVFMAISLTLGVFGHALWLVTGMIGLLLGLVAGVAAADGTQDSIWGTVGVGTFVILLAGGGATAIMAGVSHQSAQDRADASAANPQS